MFFCLYILSFPPTTFWDLRPQKYLIGDKSALNQVNQTAPFVPNAVTRREAMFIKHRRRNYSFSQRYRFPCLCLGAGGFWHLLLDEKWSLPLSRRSRSARSGSSSEFDEMVWRLGWRWRCFTNSLSSCNLSHCNFEWRYES